MKFKEKIIQFMAGRNGGDQLSTFLILISLSLTLLGQVLDQALLVAVGYVPLGVAVFRILSRNVEKRRLENYKFAIFLSPVYGRLHKLNSRMKAASEDAKVNKYVKCPQCKAVMRVPRGKGKIRVTCPKCQNKFQTKS
ncbi:zinc-ribbon domain-containing protein [Acidaminobacter hydrogenoformans]|uniref:Uncharacterized protein n=1 Tax=Acidaminobacter hydrogenoformans DSM 2784 TaxID=1120920 RepID=A0A1G5RWM0_9FIRM|nr:zinc-ribbon domain-containing protein [Acidaminobacter hydrogenoformans]SCZ78130.1 hypothetical protein SAMN03080599_01089 [Acidaminobacter hydrogenoformans DSM 2784]